MAAPKDHYVNLLGVAIRSVEGGRDDINTHLGNILAGLRDYVEENGEAHFLGIVTMAWLEGYGYGSPMEQADVKRAKGLAGQALEKALRYA